MVSQISEVLKQETSPLHEQLDQSGLMKDLMTPSLNLDSYAEILSRLYQALSWVESQDRDSLCSEWFYEKKAPLLAKDLLNLKKVVPNVKVSSSVEIKTPDEYLGALYVMHGSSLGGRFISRQVQKYLNLDETSGLAFYLSSESASQSWLQFKVKLNSEIREGSLRSDEVISGAKKAFQVFIDVFQ